MSGMRKLPGLLPSPTEQSEKTSLMELIAPASRRMVFPLRSMKCSFFSRALWISDADRPWPWPSSNAKSTSNQPPEPSLTLTTGTACSDASSSPSTFPFSSTFQPMRRSAALMVFSDMGRSTERNDGNR